MFRKLLQIPLNRYVITASVIGMVGSGSCIVALKYSQYSVLKRPYCLMAIEKLHENQPVLDLIGPPVKVMPPDLLDRSMNRITTRHADFWIPFEGTKKKGMLRIEAEKIIEQQANSTENTSIYPSKDTSNSNENGKWIIKRMEIKLLDQPDKLLIVYKDQQQQQQESQPQQQQLQG